MKTKKLLTKILSTLLIVVMIATCAPVMGFAAEGDAPVCEPVSLANVTGGVKVAYKENKDATLYTLYRRTADSDWEVIGSTKPRSYFYFTDKTGVSGETYYYSVEVTTAAGTSGHDEIGQKILYIASPTYTIENAGSTVKVTINSVSGADSYQLLRKVKGQGSLVCVATAEATDEDVVFAYDTTAQSNVTYTYAVRAVSGSEYSYQYSTDFTTLLAAPVELANVNPGVKVSYQNVEDATSYTLYRRTADSDWVVLNTIKPRSYFYFTDKTAVSGTEYFYCVGYTTADNSVTADPFGTKILYLETPTVFLSNNEDSVTIDFTEVPGATDYQIMRKPASGGTYKVIGNVPAGTLTYVDTTAELGESYTYAVRAYCDGYYGYQAGKQIDVAVFVVDDFADDFVILDAPEVIEDTAADDTVAVVAADDELDVLDVAETIEGFDFTQILDVVSNFINGLEVEEGSIFATIISVINTIIEYAYSIFALVA